MRTRERERQRENEWGEGSDRKKGEKWGKKKGKSITPQYNIYGHIIYVKKLINYLNFEVMGYRSKKLLISKIQEQISVTFLLRLGGMYGAMDEGTFDMTCRVHHAISESHRYMYQRKPTRIYNNILIK